MTFQRIGTFGEYVQKVLVILIPNYSAVKLQFYVNDRYFLIKLKGGRFGFLKWLDPSYAQLAEQLVKKPNLLYILGISSRAMSHIFLEIQSKLSAIA